MSPNVLRELPWVCLLLFAACNAQAQEARALDRFDNLSAWKASASDSVIATLRQVPGATGSAMCLDYDFNGVSGYAVARRMLPLRYPSNYEFRMQLRGNGPANNLEFKLADASGDNVWWRNQPNVVLPAEWTPIKLKKRQIGFAWGPASDRVLRASESFELTISAGKGGGKGSACIDELTFAALPDENAPLPRAQARATSSLPGAPAAMAIDADPQSAWRVGKGGQSLTLDLGRSREFGGLILHWSAGEHASRYDVEASDDGRAWRALRSVEHGNGGEDLIALPEAESRFLRLALRDGPGQRYSLADIAVQPLEFAATPNAFIANVAKRQPRGTYPRGFVGEQPYWTIVGIDGGFEQGLLGEDGAIEVAKSGFSIEPFIVSEGELLTWADVQASQSLQDGYLPIPSVQWRHGRVALEVTAFAHGTPKQSQLVARYRLTNTSDRPRDYVFALAARPFQVNPPSQFLNTVGGVSSIRTIAAAKDRFTVDGRVVVAGQAASAMFATSFDQGEIGERLRKIDWNTLADVPVQTRLDDATGLGSAALLYRVRLAPGASREFDWRTPLTGEPASSAISAKDLQREVATQWHDKLDRVTLQVPQQGRKLVDTLRTGLAHMLISRTGPRLQPGTRSYARAWIRDGAMIAEGLLRMGRADVAEEFLRWYAPYQFDNGKVPCCVDDRGSDPVPENDSHGELIFAVAELYRYTRDRALLEAMWPHVAGAVHYMEQLRLSERTEANRAKNPAFYGMMPASISHEGYSAKPMHSYWDNFWALRGYKDAVEIARWLGRDEDAKRFAASRDQFRTDLYASLDAATRLHGIDFLPGAAELGDFDATSTTIALAPGGEQAALPQALLHNTFERYWREFVARRDGTREWKDYTPYELRTVGTFVRLGWRERAHEALDFFFGDQQPAGWNQWAEVVSRTPRTPFFLGDLPHAWVESDYVRSALDMFAYSREADDALVIAAGLPADWLEGEGVAVAGLRTSQGQLAYTLKATNGLLRLDVPEGLALPKGGLVLALPEPWASGRVRGAAGKIERGEVRLERLPARVEIEAGR